MKGIANMTTIKKQKIVHLSSNSLDGSLCSIFSEFMNQVFGDYETVDGVQYSIDNFTIDTTTIDDLLSNLEILFHPLTSTLYDMIVITDIHLPDFIIKKFNLLEVNNFYCFTPCNTIRVTDNTPEVSSTYSLSAFSLLYEWMINRIDVNNIQMIFQVRVLNAFRDIAESLGTWEAVQNGDCTKYLINRCIYTLFENFSPNRFKSLILHNIVCHIDDFKSEVNSTDISKFIRQLSIKTQVYCDDALSSLVTRTLFDKTFMNNNRPCNITHVFGFVFNESYPDMIGESILAMFRDVDIAVVISDNIMHFYANDPTINIGDVITVFGGTGNARRGIVKIKQSDMSWINTARFNAMINLAGNVEVPIV